MNKSIIIIKQELWEKLKEIINDMCLNNTETISEYSYNLDKLCNLIIHIEMKNESKYNENYKIDLFNEN